MAHARCFFALVALASLTTACLALTSPVPKEMPPHIRERYEEHKRHLHNAYDEQRRKLQARRDSEARRTAQPYYSCDPASCTVPNCQCPSTANPGGFSRENTPQFVRVRTDECCVLAACLHGCGW